MFCVDTAKVNGNLFCTITILLLTVSTIAQEDKWKRLYTSEFVYVEINTSKVSFGLGKIGHIRFRWTYYKPETLYAKPDTKYKSRIEVIEFKCDEKLYRRYQAEYFDNEGKLIYMIEGNPSDEWKTLRKGSMMEKRFFHRACFLIEEKRKNPNVEK